MYSDSCILLNIYVYVMDTRCHIQHNDITPYIQSVEIDPSGYRAWYLLGRCYMATAQYTDAWEVIYTYCLYCVCICIPCVLHCVYSIFTFFLCTLINCVLVLYSYRLCNAHNYLTLLTLPLTYNRYYNHSYYPSIRIHIHIGVQSRSQPEPE